MPRRDPQPKDVHNSTRPRPARIKQAPPRKTTMATAAELIKRRLDRPAPDRWGDRAHQASHPGGKLDGGVVLEGLSLGWWLPRPHQPTRWSPRLAIPNPNPQPEQTLLHPDQGSQLPSWAFTQRPETPGCWPPWPPSATPTTTPPSRPSGRGQTELLDPQRWTPASTRQRDLCLPGELPNRQPRHRARAGPPGCIRQAPRQRRRLTRTRQGHPTGPRPAGAAGDWAV
jgi:hypothetical protein